eukprot:gene10727-gene341
MTCNPAWPEIEAALHVGQTWQSRPGIVAQVFKMKLAKVLHAIASGKWHMRWKRKLREGETAVMYELEDVRLVWRVYVIEYQTRALPHAHLVYRSCIVT